MNIGDEVIVSLVGSTNYGMTGIIESQNVVGGSFRVRVRLENGRLAVLRQSNLKLKEPAKTWPHGEPSFGDKVMFRQGIHKFQVGIVTQLSSDGTVAAVEVNIGGKMTREVELIRNLELVLESGAEKRPTKSKPKWHVFVAYQFDGGDMRTFDTEDEARAEFKKYNNQRGTNAWIVEGWDRE